MVQDRKSLTQTLSGMDPDQSGTELPHPNQESLSVSP